MTPHEILATFLETVHPTTEGFCECRALPSLARTFVPTGDLLGVAHFLDAHRHENCYLGVATRDTATSGTLDNCRELWTLFVDVDFKAIAEPAARARLALFPLPPSLIVHSGGGLHCYWQLREPIILPADATIATSLLRRLARHFDGDLASAEPARVLRLPNSFNYKPEYHGARTVTVETLDGDVPTYNASELAEWLPAEPKRPNGSSAAGDVPFTVPPTICNGERNAVLYRSARSMHAKGFGASAIRAALTAENFEKCAPPLTQAEVDAIAVHAAGQADRPDFAETETPPVIDTTAFEVTVAALLERTRTAPAVPMLIDALVPGEGITLFHAQPRALKTWCALDCALALATGTPALGLLAVPAAVPVLYVTNEDAWRVVGGRLDALLRGRGVTTVPQPLGVAIHAGVWLDDPTWQARLLARIQHVGYRVVVLDPLRSLSSCVDQGPRELQPLARFLRRLMDETGVIPLLSHHDTKPLLGQRETRQRPQRVSGGGIFSIADAPIHCERVGEDDPATTLLVPTLWKVCATPPALRVRLTSDADGARLVGTRLAAQDVKNVALDEQILAALQAHTELSTRAVTTAVHADRSSVTARLEQLAQADQVDSRPGQRNAQLWFLRTA